VNFDIIDQMLFRYSVFVRYWRTTGSTIG